ncbi:hypothetical protein [Enterobacter cloacae complex sp. CH23B]|uniref:hypothetical protein n=1 Tax=Enterobacter cloacae complex sp. CH23B TaxID=2511986 RepID=UPI001026F916|nr:hypothetical protein [Enterobacter cloacae complex sp. CH23B]RYA45763.1 hypothetical protein DD599_27445 [Enterobacter cloacae complex sp. CH23B]
MIPENPPFLTPESVKMLNDVARQAATQRSCESSLTYGKLAIQFPARLTQDDVEDMIALIEILKRGWRRWADKKDATEPTN